MISRGKSSPLPREVCKPGQQQVEKKVPKASLQKTGTAHQSGEGKGEKTEEFCFQNIQCEQISGNGHLFTEMNDRIVGEPLFPQ